jgi:hypothetical protein
MFRLEGDHQMASSLRTLALGTAAVALAAFSPALVLGQSVISAHSGTIHYTEGQVSLDGGAVQSKFGEFPEVKPGQVLATQDGRAEILLTPGVFLRLAENSSFTMVSNQLSNTRLEIKSGTAMIEVGELLQDNAIAVAFHGADVSLGKRGLYRFDSDPNRFRVYEGDASIVTPSSDPTVVRKGHEIVLGDKLETQTFDAKNTDDFYRWSARRDEYVAQANISAAKSARDSGYSGMGYNGTGYNGAGMTAGLGSWAFNPWFGMFTYLPFDGTYFSPFGYGFYSPYAVGGLYGPYSPYLLGGGGGGTSAGIFGSRPISGSRAAAGPTTNTTLSRASAFSGAMSNGGSASSGASAAARSGGGFASSGGGISSGGGGISSGGGHAASSGGGRK